MSAWTATELDSIDAEQEINIAPDRADGGPGSATTIWIVRVGDELYVRSYRGPSGRWYRRALRSRRGALEAGGQSHAVAFTDVDDSVQPGVDEAFRAKYGRHSPYVAPMITPEVVATTLRVLPA